MSSKNIMQALLCFILALAATGCGSDSDEPYHPQGLKSTPPARLAKASIRYAVYIENSASLNGYLKPGGDSSFKANVYHLIAQLNGSADKKSISFFDANSKIIPVVQDADAAQTDTYTGHLDEKTFSKRSSDNGGSQSKSDLQQILGTVMDSTQANSVNILVTDGIFSPGAKADAVTYFSQQQYSIQNRFAERLKAHPFATLVLQFASAFEGYYYDQENKGKSGYYSNRPYYAICMGNEQALQRLLGRVQDPAAFPGFRDFLFLTAKERYPVKARIIDANDYYDYNADVPMTVSNMRVSEKDKQYRVKLNLRPDPLPVSEAYLLDAGNYSISGDFRVESVKAQSGHPGHYELVLAASKAAPGNLSLALKNRLPAWIAASHTDTDKGLDAAALSGKTLGIRNILNGIYGAYYGQHTNPEYFSLTISLKE